MTGPEVSRIDAEAGGQGEDAGKDDGQQKPGADEVEVGRSRAAAVNGEDDGMECESGGVAAGESMDNLGVTATIPDTSQMDVNLEHASEETPWTRDARLKNHDVRDEEELDQMDEDEGAGLGLEGADLDSEGANVEVNSNDVLAGGIPAAWQRVLQAWNDSAVGASLEDSVLSSGEFERPSHGHGAHATSSGSAGSLAVEAAVEPLESSTSAGTRSESATESAPKQTSLKSWLK